MAKEQRLCDSPHIIHLLVFVLHSGLFVPPLVLMENYIQSGTADVPTTDIKQAVPSCVECCFRKNKTECGHCANSALVCNFEVEEKLSEKVRYYSDAEIIEIASEELHGHDENKKFEEKIKLSYGNSRLILNRWTNISQYVFSPALPYAHLTANGQQPKKLSDRTYVMRDWQWRKGARFADIGEIAGRNESMYKKKRAVLVVPQSGTYTVYIHTTFYTSEREEEEWCTLSHEVRRDNNALVEAKETVKCRFVPSHRVRRNEGITNRGLHTLDSAGTFQLDRGEQLVVHYKMPKHVRIGSIDTETYFGIFMV